MTDIKWGPAIAVDGKRPEWLDENSKVDLKSIDGTRWYSEGTSGLGVGTEHIGWQHVKLIRLPADHPHYRQTEAAIPVGMKAWHGGQCPPLDWAGPDSDTLLRNGYRVKGGYRWTHKSAEHPEGTALTDIIAYTPQPTPQADTKPDLTARMEALVRGIADVPRDSVLGQSGYASEARAIVALLPEPVDPDVELVDEVMFGFGWEREDARFSDVHAVAFDCIKRGRALALAGEKEA